MLPAYLGKHELPKDVCDPFALLIFTRVSLEAEIIVLLSFSNKLDIMSRLFSFFNNLIFQAMVPYSLTINLAY